LLGLLIFAPTLPAQQVSDTSDFFRIEAPRFALGTGPRVCVDAGHNNFHTLEGRYLPFGKILRADGYRTASAEGPIAAATLADCDVYVIANALHASNAGSWPLPNPSAFTPEEIRTLDTWVRAGGSIFLIADHMPFGGAAAELGRALGFAWLNGYANDGDRSFDVFDRASATLHDDPVTQGLDSIMNFTGSAFAIPADATPLLSLSDRFRIYFTAQPAVFSDDVPRAPAAGLHQLAYRLHGAGKVVASAEAAMFSAQLAGPQAYPVGLNNPAARQNIPLLRNLLYWLAKE
jgi:hypothetical protein